MHRYTFWLIGYRGTAAVSTVAPDFYSGVEQVQQQLPWRVTVDTSLVIRDGLPWLGDDLSIREENEAEQDRIDAEYAA